MTYNDYVEAYESYVGGARKLRNQDTKDAAFKSIDKAIAIWKKALTESNLSNKKARINEKVTKLTYFMLVEASTLTEKFDEADSYLTKLSLMKINKKDRKKADLLQKELDDQRKRITAYLKAKG